MSSAELNDPVFQLFLLCAVFWLSYSVTFGIVLALKSRSSSSDQLKSTSSIEGRLTPMTHNAWNWRFVAFVLLHLVGVCGLAIVAALSLKFGLVLTTPILALGMAIGILVGKELKGPGSFNK